MLSFGSQERWLGGAQEFRTGVPNPACIRVRFYKIVMVSLKKKQVEVMLTSWVEGDSDDIPRASGGATAALFLG